MGFAQPGRHWRQHAHVGEEIEFDRDQPADVFLMLASERGRDQHTLFIDQLDDLGRGHVGMLGEHLEQRDQKRVINQ